MTKPKKRRPNTWVALSHDLYSNHKILALAHARHHRAIAVYCCSLAWCGDNRTDGWLPSYALPSIHGIPSDAAHLVAAGLWDADQGGWWVHDWDRWQDTNADRTERTERMRGLANVRHHGHPGGSGPPDNIHALRNAERTAARNA